MSSSSAVLHKSPQTKAFFKHAHFNLQTLLSAENIMELKCKKTPVIFTSVEPDDPHSHLHTLIKQSRTKTIEDQAAAG